MQSEYMYQLLTKMKDGDHQAFHTMYDATYQDVYRTVSFLVGHQQDREDVMRASFKGTTSYTRHRSIKASCLLKCFGAWTMTVY